jgi:hypothetical protein
MPELTKETVALLQYLLPGFLAAWVFYGTTSHPKPQQFERVIQALILTFLVQALVPVARWILMGIGAFVSIRSWDNEAATLTSLFLAVVLGGSLAYLCNRDSFHRWLREKGFTTRTSHPSDWFGVFSERVTYVVLHLNDDRRLYGWPKEWPTEPEKGHFYVMQPSWIKEDNTLLDVVGADGLLVSVKDVKWVEFMHKPQE